MAPVIDTNPHVSRTYANMSPPPTSSTAFVALTLGRSANAIELSVPPAPAAHAASDLKARSFDFLADLLVPHAAHYSSAELFAAFAGHFPTSAYNATLEAGHISTALRSAFFHVDHLTALGFRSHDGTPMSKEITVDTSNRPAGISYFAFRSTVHPVAIDPRLSSIPSHSFEFWLELPQTLLPTSASSAQSDAATARKALDFATPPSKLSVSIGAAPSDAILVVTAADILAMSEDEKSSLASRVSTDTMPDYTADCFSLFSPKQIQNLVLRTALAAAATDVAPPLPALSPKMQAVLATSRTSRSSYFGPLDFLDSQVAFDAVFPNKIPLLVTTSTSGVSVDSSVLLLDLLSFVDRCKFHLFVPIFRVDYVGTADRDDAAALHATIQALKRPAMSYRHAITGHWINLTPDELFVMYADLTPLLPSTVSLWGLNLVSQFMDALSHDLQEALSTDPSYSPPDLSLLTTRSSQLDALRSLRVAAVRQFSLLRAQEKLIAKTVLRKMNPRTPGATPLAAPFSAAPSRHASFAPTGTPNDHVPVRTFMSPAEQTMTRYQPAAAASSTGACPVDPLTHFQSTYPSGFQGCMFCGSTDHVFRSCPQHDSPGASALFFKNLFAHKPHLRTRNPRPEEILSPPSASPGPPPYQSFVATPIAPPLPNGVRPTRPPTLAGSAPLPPASISRIPPPSQPTNPSPPPSPSKRARFFVQLVKSFPANLPAPTPVLPPMPIAIDNGLPHIEFDLGTSTTDDPTLLGLMDTCGALNTGYLPFHLWLKSLRPDIVAEYISFDDANPFEPIKLGGAIRDPTDFVSTDHGNLTAVIRYYTPYTDISGSPIHLSFALGPDVTVNTIFGLPLLCDLDAVISLRSNSMHSRTLNHDFPITRAAANFGLPPGCLFDPAAASRNHASTSGLPSSSAAASAFAAASPATAPLATATDDLSLGFLQRTVRPTA